MTIFSDHQSNILLSVSMDIANIKGKEELIRLINDKIKPLLGFVGLSICTFNNPEKVCENFVTDPGPRLKLHPEYERYIYSRPSVKYDPLAGMIAQRAPMVFDLEEVAETSARWEAAVLFGAGINQLICVVLEQAHQKFGMISFYLEQKLVLSKAVISLMCGIVNQIAIAVSNIIYLEEIKKRDEEKAILLSFSNDMAAVRTKHDLNVIVNERLKKMCNIKDYVISVIHENGKTHGGFMYNHESRYVKMPEFTKALNTKFEINDGIFNVLMDADKAFVFQIQSLLSRQNVPGYISFWYAIGIKTVVGITLRFGNGPIGVLWIEPEVGDNLDVFYSSLFGGITAQLSIALSNISANEKIADQLKEINQYKQQLQEEKTYLQNEIETTYSHSEIIGSGDEMKQVFQMISQVSNTDSTVLLLGETGTGKELVARAIHSNSSRKEKLMIKVNCAALPANLIESELFGHEKGSFTGALERRIGKFELADRATLFLDEIGEMPLELQVKLLRVLQEREIERLGGKGTIKVNVRIIAATNRDLLKEIAQGRFRSDLYYRLNVFPITIPPLRNRKEDIRDLSSFFITKFAKKTGKNVASIANKALQDLLDYHWPGNVRELEHLMERSVLLSKNTVIKELQFSLQAGSGTAKKTDQGYIKTIDENEREHILNVLHKCGGKVFGPHGAAVKLGVPVSTLNSKIAKLGIIKEKVVSVNEG
ncbi:sigma 54-interacting transcriptional regulator [Pedobacter sp. GSP4]|uniref:sigma 54-interacting transcriptional regulator n=1 Tax=Pedobacter sp. GSP4 TaxID=3453716 RepID=UPI003EEF3C83